MTVPAEAPDRRWTTRFAAVSSGIGAATAWIAGLAFAAIFVLNLAQMVLRQFGHGWLWVTDLSQLLLLWTVMLGAVAAFCRYEHIVTGWLDGKLTGGALRVLLIVLRVVEIGFFAILVASGAAVTQARDSIPYVQLGVPTSWSYAAIPVAAALLVAAALTLPLHAPVTVTEGFSVDSERSSA